MSRQVQAVCPKCGTPYTIYEIVGDPNHTFRATLVCHCPEGHQHFNDVLANGLVLLCHMHYTWMLV